MDEAEKKFRGRLDVTGEPGVRAELKNYNVHHRKIASKWLAEKDQERLNREEEFKRESNQTARSAKNAAWVAAIAAIIAAFSAIIVLFS